MTQKYRFTKMSEAENPWCRAALPLEYKFGVANQEVSPPVEYWLEGTLMNPIEVGQGMKIYRTARANALGEREERAGVFESSPVTKIDGDFVHTKNSVYKVREIE